MGKAGEKQKRTPKTTDKREYERFVKTARELGCDEREEEFEPAVLNKEAILELWNKGWNNVIETLESLKEEDLLKTITIRTKPLVVIDAINRQLAHYSYHVGQLVYLGRWMKNAEWQSLSIPKGGSEAYNKEMETQ